MQITRSIGSQAKEFRTARGWSVTRLAAEVSKHHSSTVVRQMIDYLEHTSKSPPSYLQALAIAMETTADKLLSGTWELGANRGRPPKTKNI